jgi:hypothetical protein
MQPFGNNHDMPPRIDPSRYLTIGHAAKLAGVSRLWMRTQVKEGKIGGIEIDGVFFAERSSVAAYAKTPAGRGRPRGSVAG